MKSSPNDKAGRIHKDAFIISTLVLFIVCLIGVVGRFYIRLCIQRRVGIDDGFLLFGTCCFIAAVVLFFYYVNEMYMTEAWVFGLPDMVLSTNFVEDSWWFHKVSDAALILTWCSLASVKFCFLFFFKNLIDRIRSMIRYWWLTFVFNAAVSAYGATVYIVACPYFNTIRSYQCVEGSRIKLVFSFALSQMILDIIGDLLILFIPCRLIWALKIRTGQKCALASCLCLTIFVIICTIMRVVGLRHNGKIDSVWEVYWQYIATATGLSVTTVTAFRSLFISNQGNRRDVRQQQGSQSHGLSFTRIKSLLKNIFSIRYWHFTSKSSRDGDITLCSEARPNVELGKVERGTITGLRSFIRNYGRTKTTPSQLMLSRTTEEVSQHDGILPWWDGSGTSENTVDQRSIKTFPRQGPMQSNSTLARPEEARNISGRARYSGLDSSDRNATFFRAEGDSW